MFSIRYKFLLVTLFLVAVSIVAYSTLALRLFNQDKAAYIYSENLTLTETIATEVETTFGSIVNTMRVASYSYLRRSGKEGSDELIISLFKDDENLIELSLFSLTGVGAGEQVQSKELIHLVNDKYLKPYNLNRDYLKNVKEKKPIPFGVLEKQKLLIQNSSIPGGIPLITLLIAVKSEGAQFADYAITATISQDKFVELFRRSSINTTFLIDSFGNLLAHPDAGRILGSENISGSMIITLLNEQSVKRGVREYATEGGEEYIFAFSKLSIGGLILVSETSREKAYLASAQLLKYSLIIALLVFFAVMIVSKVFSDRLTASLQYLYEGTQKIAKGDFDIRLKPRSNDEVGALATSFNKMAGEIKKLLTQMVEKARMEKELETAQMVQEHFFPEEHIVYGPVTISSFFRPASECGGDWWGDIKYKDSHQIVCVGDATGHGVPAALVTAVAYSMCTTFESVLKDAEFKEGLSPKKLIENFNKMFCECFRGDIFMTFFMGIIDLKTGEMVFSNAGHNFPYVLTPPKTPEDKVVMKNVIARGEPLGSNLDAEFEESSYLLQEGDKLVIYSDGIYECTSVDDKQWGKRKFQKSLKAHASLKCDEMRDNIVKDAFDFFGEQPIDDDVTLVVVNWKAADA